MKEKIIILNQDTNVLDISQARGMPKIIHKEGELAVSRYLEFFLADIRNKNTRSAYFKAVSKFFGWCELIDIGLNDITPIHVATYIEQLESTYSKPTIKQHLAAIRMLFNYLVIGNILQRNPTTSIRGPKYTSERGKTPLLSSTETRQLLDSINTSSVVGLRDRAIIALMTYSFARVSAVVSMDIEDYYVEGRRWWIRLHEKGGKRHEIQTHQILKKYLDKYIQKLGITGGKHIPLFRTVRGRSEQFTKTRLNRIDVYRMIKRRMKQSGLETKVSCHSFRATGITAYLNNGGYLEYAQKMAAHSSPSTTKLYDRTNSGITSDELEKILI